MQWEENRTNFDRNLAVVIGIDRYNSNGIHDLKTAVGDAIAIADLLEKEYAYKKTDIIQLLDGEATLTGLKDLLSDTIPNQLKPTSSDRLIFYYAGHGIPRNSKDGPAGYLVPQDADLNNADSFLPMQYVYEQLSQLTCHHLLVILDCCFAGTFQWAGSRKLISMLETVRREHYDRFIRFPAWQVITSSAHDQEAMDVALDNTVLAEDNRGTVTNSSHSPFALALIEGLKDNRADLIPDGVVTAHELYLYLEQRVSELSKQRQNPGLYPLRREYDRGEFIFTKPGFTRDQLDPAPLLNENSNPYRGLKSFDEKHAALFFGRQVLIDELVKHLTKPNQALTVVLGVSGSGKSSLVKAGLIPHLRNVSLIQVCLLELLIQFSSSPLKLRLMNQIFQWKILEPMRPGESPFTSLARTLLPIAHESLLARLAEVSFLDDIFQPVLQLVAEPDKTSENETLRKVADSWCNAEPEVKLLLIEDYYTQLEALVNPQQRDYLKNLYDQILKTLGSVSEQLKNEPQYFKQVISTWQQKYTSMRLFLLIDQFEELLTRSQDDRESFNQTQEKAGESTEQKEWQEFLEVVRIAIADKSQTLRLLLTLRSDFEPRFLTSALEPYWKDARFPVRAMTSDELRQAIENPGLKQALYFEELKDEKGNTTGNLVSKLVDEVGQMPGALPLLSFTLSELYVSLYRRWQEDQSTGRTLRLADYEALGGVAGALTLRATQEYEALDENHQATMRRVMLRMVAIEGEVARRQVLISELIYPNQVENDRVRQVIERLVIARLLVKGQKIGEPYVEAAHDFLVRGWDKLQDWIQKEQPNLFLQQRLSPAAIDWEKNHQDIEYLWIRDPRLALLEKILESETNNWLNGIETTFVQKSKDRRQDELEETKRQLRISEERQKKAEDNQKEAKKQTGNALTNASEAFWTSDQQLEALLSALKSIKILINSQDKLSLDRATFALQQAVYGVQEKNRLEGHSAGVTSVSISPDGKLIASGSYDGNIKLWKPDGGVIKTLKLHNGTWVTSVNFSHDGQKIVSTSYNGAIILWNRDGSLRQTLQESGRGGLGNNATFSPDDRAIASTAGDGAILLWNLNNGDNIKPIQFKNPTGFQPIDKLTSLSFAPNDRGRIALLNKELNSIEILDTYDRRLINKIPEDSSSSDEITSFSFSPNGQTIVVGSKSGIAQVWSLDSARTNKILQFSHEAGVNSVSFSHDGSMIASGCDDGSVSVWSSLDGTLLNRFKGHKNSVNSVRFSHDNKTVISASEDKSIRLWSLDKTLLNVLRGHSNFVRSVRFSHDGTIIASASEDGTVKLWSRDSGKEIVPPLKVSNQVVSSVSFSPDDQLIATGSYDGDIKLWSNNGRLLKTFDQKNKPGITSLSFSPNGKLLASAGYDNKIRLWNSNGELLKTLEGHEKFVTGVSFSPDGKTLASSSEDGKIRLWSIDGATSSNQKIIGKIIDSHNDIVYGIAFSPDGETIASANFDKPTVKLWNRKGDLLKTLEGHQSEVVSVNFSPDGTIIASASWDRTVKLWNLQGQLLKTLTGHNEKVWDVSFSPDGQIIASASGGDNTIRLWKAETLDFNSLIQRGCNLLNAYLNNNPNTLPDRHFCL